MSENNKVSGVDSAVRGYLPHTFEQSPLDDGEPEQCYLCGAHSEDQIHEEAAQ
jgi:hypothetical protein